jgi:beta-xylosidase
MPSTTRFVDALVDAGEPLTPLRENRAPAPPDRAGTGDGGGPGRAGVACGGVEHRKRVPLGKGGGGMRHVIRAALGAAAISVGVQAAAFGSAGPASAASSTFTAPAYPGDFPDPAILPAGGMYWAYSTGSAGRNLQVMSSSDLHTWTAPTDPLPTLPSWASSGHTWAPSVIEVDGRYVMYYTVRDSTLNIQCVSVATNTFGPGATFTDSSPGPLVCQTTDGGSIDPNPYLDPISGNLYLVWKSDDNSIGKPTHIWGQRLSANGLSFAPGTSPSQLLTESAFWQAPAVEGPTLIHHGSAYYLFYGANSYNSANSGIGYATSNSPLGVYSNQSRMSPWLATSGNAEGPQGPMVFQDSSGNTRMAFAAWYGPVGYQNGGARALWIGSLGFNRYGTPTIS